MNDIDTQSSSAGCLVRSLWFLGGPSLLTFLLFYFFHHKVAFPSWMDGLYLATLLGTVVVRYIDVIHLKGQTATGASATLSDWRVYSIILCVLFGAAWGLVRFVVS